MGGRGRLSCLLSLLCVLAGSHAVEQTQCRVDGVESAAVLWGVALRPSRPSSALAVRVERRLAHRRVAGPRKLGTRRPEGRADPDTKQHRRGGRAPRRQRFARRREAERTSARPKRRRADAVQRTARRGGRPRAKAPAARGGCPVPKVGNSTPSRAVRDGGRISSFRHGARRAALTKRAAVGGRGLLYGGRGARWAA